jgi:Copper amine oxidase, enzyme domain
VVWHSSGHTHVCKPEYFQIMPVEYAGFMLKPVGFFRGECRFRYSARAQPQQRAERRGWRRCGLRPLRRLTALTQRRRVTEEGTAHSLALERISAAPSPRLPENWFAARQSPG